MDETQSFRIAGTSDVKNIDVDIVNGQSVIFWEDIEQVFPRVGHICNGSSVVKLVRDSNRARIVPHCIKHYPGVVLDVVLATGANCIHEDSSVANSRLAPTNGQVETPIHAPVDPYRPGTIIDELDISIQASSTATLTGSVSGHEIGAKPFADISSAEPHQATTTRGNNTYIQNQFISLAAAIEQARQSGKPLTTEALSSLIASKLTLASMAKSGFERTVISKLEGLYNQGAMTQQIAREVWELQKQMNDRLILIQSKTEAILTQQLELAEYPIPRLFVVLPEEPAKYDPGNWFRTKFRLHFICECGKHTEPNNSKIPHHLHLAKHGGITGHIVSALANLKVVELADSIKQSVETVTAKIDYSLQCIDNQMAKVQASSPGDFIGTEPRAAMTQQDLTNYLSDVEGLEGVELRQLAQALTEAFKTNLTLTILDLKFLSVGDEGAQDLAEALKTNSTLTTLNLSCSSVGEKGAQALAEALKTNSTLTALDVSTMIGDKGVQALAEALKTNSTLTTLSCGANSIGEKGAMAMAETLKTNSTLTSLDLSSISIGVKGAQALAEALKINSTLTTLNLGHRSIGEKGA
ncbi:hypothetical protein F5H01DRAFT_362240 [Linnemannia elongata]|nr:hypothetical protein F5H01DRAFT_362240 [Linnemannia elongata]